MWPAANEGCCTLRCQWVKVASSSTVPTGPIPNCLMEGGILTLNVVILFRVVPSNTVDPNMNVVYPKMNIISNAAVILTQYNKQ